MFSRIGNVAIDLSVAADEGAFQGTAMQDKAAQVFAQASLNAFMALGPECWRAAREAIQRFVRASEGSGGAYVPVDQLAMLLPVQVGDYTDFYASKEHATNVGIMFRGKENALMPNWTHIPVGYHGRASSIVVSGTPVLRPHGQVKAPDGPPALRASAKLDFELEMGFIVGVGNALGSPIPVSEADRHIFGVVLLNDWSARDVQAWEYVPLGPFLGKSFCTSISAWVVTLQALEPFLVQGPEPVNPVLPYLKDTAPAAYDVALEVTLQDKTVCRSNLKHLYWSFRQQLAHHTVNGCNMRTGDICGTGTISGPTEDSFGSLLELSWNGTKPLALAADTTRTFLEDGDTVVMSGVCQGDGYRVGFGECVGTVAPNPLS